MRTRNDGILISLSVSLSVSLSITACVLGLACSPALALLTQDSVQKVLKAAKLFSDANRVNVVCNANQVVVSTYREHGSADKDCKIDTVLAMRKIMQADPEITRLTVRFYDMLQPHDYRQIEVRQSDVAAFGGKLINDDKLLSGISITRASDLPQVVPGPFGEERAAIKQHIGQLQAKGVGIAAYLRLFSEVEELASKADAESKAAAAAAAAKPAGSGTDTKPDEKPADGKTAAAATSTTAETEASSATMEKLRTSLNSLLQKLDEQEQAARQIKQTEKTAVAARPSAAQPAASSPSSGTSSGGSFNRTESLGAFVPAEGPFLLDRIMIGRKLADLRSHSMMLQTYVELWRHMDSCANRRDSAQCKADVDAFFKQLAMPPISDEQRNRTQLVRVK